jgi:hypothetical protein
VTGRYRSKPTPDASTTEAALDAMDADGLRALILEMIPWFDDVLHARFVNALVDRAARTTPNWAPKAPDSAQVGEIQQFAEAAKRIGYAEPSDVDAYLRQGANAFLAKNYAAAFQIFRALLIPAGHGEFHLGQDETIDEVLGIDPATCAAQYVASMYMTATPKNRGKAVLSAIDEMHGIGHFWEPLRELERVAIEPLPDDPERDFDELSLLSERDEPRVATPKVGYLIRLAGIQAPTDPAARAAVVKSMRAAAEKRIAGVTENKRRRHYGHAASLALACAQVDSSTAGTKWLDGIRDEYRRFPALQRELGGRKGRA